MKQSMSVTWRYKMSYLKASLILCLSILNFQIFAKIEIQKTFFSKIYKTRSSTKMYNILNEPSGIVFHPKTNSFFIVSDSGWVAEMSTSGKIKRKKFIKDADFEGITVNPTTGTLYIAIEGSEKILEVSQLTLDPKREFKIPRKFKKIKIFPKGGNGIESITFVPNSNNPNGGTFFVANQSLKGKEKSYLVELNLPLKSTTKEKVKILNVWETNIQDISGLNYNSATNHIQLISDFENIYAELDLSGRVLKQSSLPGFDQEGIATDNAGNIYLAIDGDKEGHDSILKLCNANCTN